MQPNPWTQGGDRQQMFITSVPERWSAGGYHPCDRCGVNDPKKSAVDRRIQTEVRWSNPPAKQYRMPDGNPIIPHDGNVAAPMTPADWTDLERDAVLGVMKRRDPSRLCPYCGLNDPGLLVFHPDWPQLRTADPELYHSLRKDQTSTKVTCGRCRSVVYAGCRNVDAAKFRRLVDVGLLRRGDEISWHRGICACCSRDPTKVFLCCVFHHGIFTGKTSNDRRAVEVIAYDRTGCKVNVVTKYSDVDVVREDVYVVDYEESYDAESALQRAQSRVGNDNKCFNLVSNNCEQVVRWSKTGNHDSYQTHRFACDLFIVFSALLLRLSAIAVLLIIDYLVPRNTTTAYQANSGAGGLFCESSLGNAELWISLVIALLYAVVAGAINLYQQCKHFEGTVGDVGCAVSCAAKTGRGYCCFNNCGITARLIGETVFEWILPIIGAALFQIGYDCSVGHSGLTYLYTCLVLAAGLFFGYFVGSYVGRCMEQFMDHCLCRAWHRRLLKTVKQINKKSAGAVPY